MQYNANSKYDEKETLFHAGAKNGTDVFEPYNQANTKQTDANYYSAIKNDKRANSSMLKSASARYDKQDKITNVAEVSNNDIM